MPLENAFQRDLVKELKQMLRGCIVLKNDSGYRQGVPDLIILFEDRWATLECKKSRDADVQPNQPYYVSLMNEMSYSAFVYPENKEVILDEIAEAFGVRRKARLSQRK